MTRTIDNDHWESVAFLLMCGTILLWILGLFLLWIGVRLWDRPMPRSKARGGTLFLASCLIFLSCYWGPSFAFRQHFGIAPLNQTRNRSDEGIPLIGMTEESVLRHLGPPHLVVPTENRLDWFYWCDSFCRNWEVVVFGPDGKVMGGGIN